MCTYIVSNVSGTDENKKMYAVKKRRTRKDSFRMIKGDGGDGLGVAHMYKQPQITEKY